MFGKDIDVLEMDKLDATIPKVGLRLGFILFYFISFGLDFITVWGKASPS